MNNGFTPEPIYYAWKRAASKPIPYDQIPYTQKCQEIFDDDISQHADQHNSIMTK